ncbi:MAG: ABC transporter permease, partial [Puniceicoccales bacterium]
MKPFGEKAKSDAGRSLGADAWQRLYANRMAMGGLIFTVLVTLACVIGPWLLPYGPETQNLDLGASGPSGTHWLGTDILGRDLLARILSGGRVSLM